MDAMVAGRQQWLKMPRLDAYIDNLAKAERLGWIASGSAWIECRQLRNFMVHEYVRDSTFLAAALTRGHEAVAMLTTSAQTLAGLVLADEAARQ